MTLGESAGRSANHPQGAGARRKFADVERSNVVPIRDTYESAPFLANRATRAWMWALLIALLFVVVLEVYAIIVG